MTGKRFAKEMLWSAIGTPSGPAASLEVVQRARTMLLDFLSMVSGVNPDMRKASSKVIGLDGE